VQLVWQRPKKARVDQRIHDLRVTGKRVSQTWCDSKDQDNQSNKIGVLAEQ